MVIKNYKKKKKECLFKKKTGETTFWKHGQRSVKMTEYEDPDWACFLSWAHQNHKYVQNLPKKNFYN